MRGRLSRVLTVEDLRQLARRRAPRVVFDYVDGGAGEEATLRENPRAWNEVLFRPRHAVRTMSVDLHTTLFGARLPLPLILAPIGNTRLLHNGGEVAAASAAREAGVPYVLSTFSGYPVAEVAAAAGGGLWYQLYLPGGRDVAEAALARAWSAGARVLVVTIDTNWPGLRGRDLRNGAVELSGDRFLPKLRFLPQLLARPRWLAGFLTHRRDTMHYANVIVPGEGPLPARDVGTVLANSAMDWADMSWIRQAWRGPIVIKGVLTADDARRAIDEGAAGLVVSNHGGRQLDTCYPSARALPEVLQAAAGRTEVMVDSGIRTGADIAKALAMGARAVMVGRSYAYGLMAAGQRGVARAIDLLRADLERTLILLGCTSVRTLDGSYVEVPSHWRSDRAVDDDQTAVQPPSTSSVWPVTRSAAGLDK